MAFAISNVQGHGTTCELGLVALNCERMVDNGGHALAVYSRCSTLHCFIAIALELRCFAAIASRFTASVMTAVDPHGWGPPLEAASKERHSPGGPNYTKGRM